MRIQWLGHAAFLITSEQQPAPGIRVVTDPYTPVEGRLDYAPPNVEADVVVMSHNHGDHNNAAAIQGNPEVVRAWELGSGTHNIRNVPFHILSVFHDDSQGSQRGVNAISCFEIDGMRVCHLGDLGHPLSAEQMAALGQVDVLLIPVGGAYTVDAATASQVTDQIAPKVVLPMHVKNERCSMPLAEVSDFAGRRANVQMVDGSEISLQRGALPAQTQTIVLKPAC